MSDAKRGAPPLQLFVSLREAYKIHCENDLQSNRSDVVEGRRQLRTYATVLRVYYFFFQETTLCVTKCEKEDGGCAKPRLVLTFPPNMADTLGEEEKKNICSRLDSYGEKAKADMAFASKMEELAREASNGEEIRSAIIRLDQSLLLLAHILVADGLELYGKPPASQKRGKGVEKKETDELTFFLLSQAQESLHQLVQASLRTHEPKATGCCARVSGLFSFSSFKTLGYLVGPAAVVGATVAVVGAAGYLAWFYTQDVLTFIQSLGFGTKLRQLFSGLLDAFNVKGLKNYASNLLTSLWQRDASLLRGFYSVLEKIRGDQGVSLGSMITIPLISFLHGFRKWYTSSTVDFKEQLAAVVAMAVLYILRCKEMFNIGPRREIEVKEQEEALSLLVFQIALFLGSTSIYLVHKGVGIAYATVSKCCRPKEKASKKKSS